MREAIGYIRVSTARQGRSGLGLEAQRAAISRFAEAEAFNLEGVRRAPVRLSAVMDPEVPRGAPQ
jgi:DNA invertase Pin-like site-specific DNA recombinase